MITMPVSSWSSYKSLVTAKDLRPQYVENSTTYEINSVEDGFTWQICLLKDGGSDVTDFETSYKAVWNTPVSSLDSDGALIVRNKAAKKGWTFCSLPFEFDTSRLSDSLVALDYQGNQRSFITLKAYNGSGTEVTTPGLLNANYATIVKTVIDFEPPYDYEVIGGDLRTLSVITDDIRLWLVAAPDIAAPTGSKEMGGGINLKYLAPGNVWSVDGRVTKYATYNATYHTGKIRLILRYPAGTCESLQVVVQFYKQ